MPYCPKCGSEVGAGEGFCPDCGQKLSVSGVPQRGTPRPMTVKKATAGFAISLIAGILILINAIIVLVGFSLLGGLGFGIPGLEFAAGFILAWGAIGLIFAILVIVGAILIYKPGNEVKGGILVLLFSLFSLIIGGGFVIGTVLGIIGGILGMIKK